ncbi:hypothetical protein PVAG01_03765 [Phlyctema vagabunda]|uniref:Cytochrome p450 protein n=1 Tax=Phlyctema vagabunda TaxID=108571 RepID=A0ABR4PMF0_9HELO
MQLTRLFSLASYMGVVLGSAVPLHRRETFTNITLYAYGTNISGLPILYGDGLAYIGAEESSNLSSLTWEISNTGTEPWNVTTSDGSNSNSSTAASFYIIDDGTSFAAAGFLSANTTTTTNMSTTGFSMFGGQVIHIADSMYEAQFWAQATAQDGVWSLMWNADGSTQVDSVPVAVKTLPPGRSSDQA